MTVIGGRRVFVWARLDALPLGLLFIAISVGANVKKSALVLALVVLAATVIAVIVGLAKSRPEPSRAESADQPVILRLSVPPVVRLMGDVADRTVLDTFLQDHPEIKLEPWTQMKMNGPRGEATFYMAMAGEQAPDALYVYERSLQKYINQDFLYPLNEYLEGEHFDDPLMQKFSQRQDVLEATSRGDKIYAIPALVNVHALLYRKDLFKADGLDPDKPPTTWEELLDTAQTDAPAGRSVWVYDAQR
ncbi:MAG: extracellular solute-binding protein [Planctomycetaceae bacterium]|nr:MAG: extracellular solute-binding protein [Planctomycetaceae bacterium]